MSCRVVESLEVIEVEHQYAQVQTAAFRPRHLPRQRFFHVAAVVKACKRIPDGLHAERFTRGYELLLKTEYPLARIKAGPELVSVERLGEVVVGAGS